MKIDFTPNMKRFLQRRLKMTPRNKRKHRNVNGSAYKSGIIKKNNSAPFKPRRSLKIVIESDTEDEQTNIDLERIMKERRKKKLKSPSRITKSNFSLCVNKYLPKNNVDDSIICVSDVKKSPLEDSVIVINDTIESEDLTKSTVKRKSDIEIISEPIKSCKKPVDESVIVIDDSIINDDIAVVWSNCEGDTQVSKEEKKQNKNTIQYYEDRSPNYDYISLFSGESSDNTKKKEKRQKQTEQPSGSNKSSVNNSHKNAEGLREIIIDGCNIALAYKPCKGFDEKKIQLVVDYFQKRGHRVTVFVPQHKRSQHRPLLEQYHKEGIVVFTASRKVGGKSISSYDDRYILEYATMCDGIVVSLDQFRDLYDEKPEWRHTIQNRILQPTFVGGIVMFPDDPLGRKGPTLDEFLRH